MKLSTFRKFGLELKEARAALANAQKEIRLKQQELLSISAEVNEVQTSPEDPKDTFWRNEHSDQKDQILESVNLAVENLQDSLKYYDVKVRRVAHLTTMIADSRPTAEKQLKFLKTELVPILFPKADRSCLKKNEYVSSTVYEKLYKVSPESSFSELSENIIRAFMRPHMIGLRDGIDTYAEAAAVIDYSLFCIDQNMNTVEFLSWGWMTSESTEREIKETLRSFKR